MKELFGTGIALCTPFEKNKEIDFLALERLVETNITNGVNYLVALGTTAETATLSKEEKKSVVDCILQTNAKRLPIVLGIGGNNTIQVKEEISSAKLTDFAAILSVSPFYNKPNQEGIYQHYKYLATETEANIIIYNVPSRTGANINPETTLRLAHDFKNLIGIKDAPLDFRQFLDVLQSKPKDFLVISGDDLLAVPAVLAGADGVISVIGQAIPKHFSTMIQFALDGKNIEANNILYKIIKLIDLIFEEGNPTGIKTLLSCLDISQPNTRLPIVEGTQGLKQKLEKEINNLKRN